MPKSAYFHGHGRSVYRDMIERYGRSEGARVFYATASKRHLGPKRRVKKRH